MAAAAEAAAVATAAASGAFRYNRENYMFDQGLRWGRFTTGYSMAMAQAGMYREDIRDLTAMTVTKADTYHTVGVIFFVLNFQLIMAGRLGVHGPSPPGWILAIYWCNICSCTTFLTMFTWMAMHAGARATAGGAYMLTRHARLPIPTPKMLDKARKTGNSFEKQRVSDVFRIPFVMPAAQETEADPEGGRVPISDRRMPKWYHDEVEELRKDEGGATPGPNSNPEHFELYRGLQEEWWGYDVYSRIGVLFFMSNWLTAASLYSQCHVFTELRMVWPAYTVTAAFVTAHYGILCLDIVNDKPRDGGCMSIKMERIVPFVPCLTVVGLTIDYSVLTPSPVWQGMIYTLAWFGYIIQFLWALRMYDLASPVAKAEDRKEVPGQPWWPHEWPLPPAFEDAIYMVAAPRSSEQTCIQQEMKAAKGKKAHEVAPVRAKHTQPAMLPWKLFRGACITVISMYVLIMVGRAFEQINGERWLLKQEGRVERWPSHVQGWMAPWTRKGSRQEMCHAGGCDRRLSAAETMQHQELAFSAQRLVAALSPIAHALEAVAPATTTPSPRVAKLRNQKVAWPADVRPTVLASVDGAKIAALAAGRRGAMLGAGSLAPFVMRGIDELGEVVGAMWGAPGLMVATSEGAVAECAGIPVAGVWPCRRVGAPALRLPSGLTAAVAGRHEKTGRLQAAVVFDGDNTVVILEADEDEAEWLPAGEARAPSGGRIHLSMTSSGEELVISTADGHVVKRSMKEHTEIKTVSAPHVMPGAQWYGACSLEGDRVAHLATVFGPDAMPELFVSPAAPRAAFASA